MDIIIKKTYRIFVTAVVTMLIATGASGQTTTAVKDKNNDAERVELIRNMLNENRFSNSLWWYGWMGIYTATSAGSFAAAYATKNDVTRITQNVSGVESVIGLMGVIFSPMPPAYAGNRLDRMPFSTAEERAKKLAAAEGYLRETSETQEFGRSWINQGLNFAVNAAGGLIIWKGYGDRIEREGGKPLKEGLMNFIMGLAVSEIQIFTQPTGGIGQWKSYNEKYSSGDAESAENIVTVFAVPGSTGISVGLTLSY